MKALKLITQPENLKSLLSAKLLEGVYFAKSGVYFLESYPLIYLDQWIQTGKLQKTDQGLSERELFDEVKKLVQSDIDNIQNGYYGIDVLKIENPITHLKNLFLVYKDSLQVSKKKKQKKSKEFNPEAQSKIAHLPDYYQRNFHFQTDGYLSENSASIYDHQVEILFRGTADVMRRLILKPMVQALGSEKRHQILEIGCGTGISTYPIAKTFKKSRIKAIDLSEDYVAFCKKEYSSLKYVNFDQGLGEDLAQIKSESQDAWCSTFMFHELPKDIRKKVIDEAYRVLKPGGWIFIVDSMQHNDRPEFKKLMDLFPQNFHEPFYKNYVSNPLEDVLKESKFENIRTEVGFVSKVCWAQKS